MESVLTALHPDTTTYRVVGSHNVAWCFSNRAEEYTALRTRAGVLDFGTVPLIEVRGADAPDLLQRTLARDVEYLTSERCLTSLVLDDDGRPVDVVVVYGRDGGALLEPATGGERLLAHLREHADGDVEIVERTDLAMVGVEGPYSWGIIGRLIDEELTALPFEAVTDTTWLGHEIIFARSGYTGEYGYKVIGAHDAIREFWHRATQTVPPIGRDVLELAMLEVRQPVPQLEWSDDDGVLELGLNWLVDSTKEDYVGRTALLGDDAPAMTRRRTIGFSCADLLPAPGTPVLVDGEEIGSVVVATHSVALGRSLGLARVESDFAAAGLQLAVTDGNGAEYAIDTLSSPYIVPKSWGVPIV